LAVPPAFDPKHHVVIPNLNLRFIGKLVVGNSNLSDSDTGDDDSSDSSSEDLETYGWWYVEHLAKIVEEVIDLAKIRAVDIDAMRVPDDIDSLTDAIDGTLFGGPFGYWFDRTVNFDETLGLGHFLPALYVPIDPDEDDGRRYNIYKREEGSI